MIKLRSSFLRMDIPTQYVSTYARSHVALRSKYRAICVHEGAHMNKINSSFQCKGKIISRQTKLFINLMGCVYISLFSMLSISAIIKVSFKLLSCLLYRISKEMDPNVHCLSQ